jgi:hypothetical protein
VSTFRLGLALPTLQMWDADFSISVFNLYQYMMKVKVPGYTGQSMALMNRRSSLIAKSRQELVQDAIKQNCSHILFIDSDQVFPPSIAHRLAKPGCQVIGCNIATKAQDNSIPTARRAPKEGEWWGGHIIYSNHATGVEQVWRVGFGVMMINLDVFKGLEYPWFNQEWRGPPVNDFCGEDWFFIEKMEKKGIPIFIDHDLSREIGHVGKWIYGHEGVENIPAPEAK